MICSLFALDSLIMLFRVAAVLCCKVYVSLSEEKEKTQAYVPAFAGCKSHLLSGRLMLQLSHRCSLMLQGVGFAF